MIHWPGDPEPSFERISEIDAGADANVTFCRMSAHTGTHMDAPCHFLRAGRGIEVFPLEAGIGRARVVAVPANSRVIGRAELENKEIEPGDRVLLKTRNSFKRWNTLEFQTDYAAIDGSAARFLVEKQVQLIGVDYLSVGAFRGDGRETHKILLEGGVWIAEGLDLSSVDEGLYELICLPLGIEGSDGSPARVVLRAL